MIMVIGLRDAARWPHWCALAFGCLLLGLAKEQFFLLPLALLLAAMPALWPVSRRGSLAMLAVALVPVAALALSSLRPGGVQQANRVNAYLGAVLPASHDPAATLARLGLPARCAALSGVTWYLRRGEVIEDECPAVLRISSAAFLKLAPGEPRTLADVLARVLPTTQNAFLGNLGVVEGAHFAGAESLGTLQASVWTGLATQFPAFAWMVLAAFALLASAAALAWVALASTRRAHGPRALPAWLVLLAIVFTYALGTTAFGDGFSESARHQLLGTAALYAWLIAAFALVVKTLGGEATAWQRVALVIGLAAAGGALLPMVKWLEGERLAFGLVMEPAGNRAAPAGFTLQGFAIDPFGVAEVRARIGNRLIPGTLGLPSSELNRIFPSWPESKRAGFAIAMPADALATLPATIVVEVKNGRGVVTEIDRRRWQAPAEPPAAEPPAQVAK
jgi:hypothetical protein